MDMSTTNIRWRHGSEHGGTAAAWGSDENGRDAGVRITEGGRTVEHVFHGALTEHGHYRATCSCGYRSKWLYGAVWAAREQWMDAHAERLVRNARQRARIADGTETPRQRDSQRQKVYNAERAARQVHPAPRSDLAYSKALIERMSATPAIREAIKLAQVKVVAKKKGEWATASRSRTIEPVITLPPWAHNTHTVIHEMAHVVADNLFDRNEQHGPVFVAVLLAMCYRFDSDEYAVELARAVVAGKVKWDRAVFHRLYAALRADVAACA